MRASLRVVTAAFAAGALSWAASTPAAHASAVDEAKSLYNEAMALIKKARAPGGDVVHGSHEAIRVLEKAAAILGEPADGSPAAELLQSVNSLIFWTRRTTPMDMSAILSGSAGRGGGSSSSGSPGAGASSKPSTPEKGSPPAGANLGAQAVEALARAEGYARAHGDDPMTCAARFFEIADRYKDVHDVAFKAISRAQELQRLAEERKALREAEAKFDSLPPDEKRMVEGDRAFAARQFDVAAAKYAWAIDYKAAPGRHRKLGHARFNRAQQLRSEYSAAYRAAALAYRQAQARGNQAAMERARRKALDAGAIGKQAVAAYSEAQKSFRSALDGSPGRMDLDSELHVALTLVIRREKFHRNNAQRMLEDILRKYRDRLKTDEDRTLYAYAETYAGGAAVRKVQQEAARKAAASAGRRGADAPGAPGLGLLEDEEKAPDEMTVAELKAAHAELRKKLTRDEVRLKSTQATGRFDKRLLDRVNAGRKRLKELEREIDRRGLR